MAVGLEPSRGPRLGALLRDDVRVLDPSHPATLATSRDACAPRRANDAPRDADDRRAVRLPPRERLKAWRPAQAKPRARPELAAPRRRLVQDRTRGRKRLTARRHADAPPG
jgi:hypothetical protein